MSKLLIVLNLPIKISGAEPMSQRRPDAHWNFFNANTLFYYCSGLLASAVSFVTVHLLSGWQKVQVWSRNFFRSLSAAWIAVMVNLIRRVL